MTPDPDAIAGSTYLAALAGAVVGLRAIPGTTYWERVANLVSGFLVAVYLGPAVVDYVHIVSPRVAAGLTFVVGAGGLVVFAAVIDGVKQTPLAQIFQSWLSRRNGSA